MPHRKADDIDEERRIAYVIATRARDLLRISSLDSWNDSTVAPSRFLSGLSLQSSSSQSQEDDLESEAELFLDEPKKETNLGGLFFPNS